MRLRASNTSYARFNQFTRPIRLYTAVKMKTKTKLRPFASRGPKHNKAYNLEPNFWQIRSRSITCFQPTCIKAYGSMWSIAIWTQRKLNIITVRRTAGKGDRRFKLYAQIQGRKGYVWKFLKFNKNLTKRRRVALQVVYPIPRMQGVRTEL